MIRHIVCFTTTGEDTAGRAETARRLQAELESLTGRVPELRHLEVGLDLGEIDGHWDAVLLTDFDSSADLAAYQAHPAHVEVVGRIAPLVAGRAVVDYRL